MTDKVPFLLIKTENWDVLLKDCSVDWEFGAICGTAGDSKFTVMLNRVVMFRELDEVLFNELVKEYGKSAANDGWDFNDKKQH